MQIKVVVDPGHGGEDSGAVGNGLQEKVLTLKTGLFLRDMLHDDARYDVRMTRTTDAGCQGLVASTGPELSARAAVANTWNADFFIAIHFNSFNGVAAGEEVLDFNGTGKGQVFAAALCSILETQEKLINRGVKDTNKTFAVIRETNCPAVITESAFIDNAADIAHFDTDAELKTLAWYHYSALCKTFGLDALQTLNPAYKAPVVANPTLVAIQKLAAAGKLHNPEYWTENAVPGKTCDGGWVGFILQGWANSN